MSSNLPPGVTDSMIPGNRPEDLKAEALADAIFDALEKSGLTHGPDATGKNCDEAVELLSKIVGDAYGEAYKEGQRDEAQASAHNREESSQRLVLLAVEFGFKQCEKGNNLERALANADEVQRGT